ncbi:MAG: ABC transporter permease, partial [Chitinophagaceae bacterium]
MSRNKAFSVINILGLALGLTSSLFIFLWVKDEYNMDKFNIHSSQLYDIYERIFTGGKIQTLRFTPGVMAAEMKRVFPQIQYASGFTDGTLFGAQNTFRAGDKVIKENGGAADSDFFKMFNYPLLEGNAASALNEPGDIAISQSMADQLFGNPVNAINKLIQMNDQTGFRVSAVFKLPENSSDKFNYLINWYAFLNDQSNMKSWNNTGVSTYIMLKDGADPAIFQKEITGFLKKYAEFSGDYHVELGLQHFDKMYLYSHFSSAGYPDGGRIEYVRLFSIIAILILLIACINFMNLTTARSSKRAKEV